MKAKLYLDACMIIDLVEGSADQQERLSSALKGCNLVGSELARMESRIGALRQGQTEYLATYDRFFESCIMVPMDLAVFDLATEMRVQHGIKTPDALHLAIALCAGCEELWTNDKRLASAAAGRIRILTWDDFDSRTQQAQADNGTSPSD